MRIGAASAPPRTVPRWRIWTLLAAAVLSIAAWQATERFLTGRFHARLYEMQVAARAVATASRVVAADKSALGLMQPPDLDPNRTGLIGSEFTGLTTTIGDLPSKRTVTNPDFAAALVRVVDGLRLPRGTPVVVILSGSFVGADIGALAAVEALGLEPIVIVSLSASMYGATDPAFNILDLLGTLRRHGVIGARATTAVFGGELGVARGMDAEVVVALRASASREGVEIVDAPAFPGLVGRLLERVRAALAGRRSGLVINVGGALVGLGTCPQSFEYPPGLSTRPIQCGAGHPGLVGRLAEADGAPVLHIINIRRLALDWGLPFDPRPLPRAGANRAVYGER